jgi:hypothetical protein
MLTSFLAVLGVPVWESAPFLGRVFKRCRANIRAKVLNALREREAAMRMEKSAPGPDLLSLLLAAGMAQEVCFLTLKAKREAAMRME